MIHQIATMYILEKTILVEMALPIPLFCEIMELNLIFLER